MLTDITQYPFHLGLRVGDLELGVCHVVVTEAEQRGEVLPVAIVPAVGDFG